MHKQVNDSLAIHSKPLPVSASRLQRAKLYDKVVLNGHLFMRESVGIKINPELAMKGAVMCVLRSIRLAFLLASFVLFLISLEGRRASAETEGESLFKEHCSVCHPDGGNVINPLKTLHKKDLNANNIKTAEDVVNKMRTPGPVPTHPQEWGGMKIFDRKKISDEKAIQIAEYSLKTFQ